MERPAYLDKYYFDWELFDVILGGKSALDAHSFLVEIPNTQAAQDFLLGYGFDIEDPVNGAEIFGNFQEAKAFIERYFLKPANPEGLEVKIPVVFSQMTEVGQLFLMADGKAGQVNYEERIWAGIILKVMHTVIHIDKDIRQSYFPIIQTQIFDRFYKFISRDSDGQLYLGEAESGDQIPLVDFMTKAKKSRDSTIIKLLHKAENVAEELFDRVGVRFITYSRLDCLRAIKFLQEKNIIVPHNIKPSRSLNSLVDFEQLRPRYRSVLKMAMRNNLSEKRFHRALEREVLACSPQEKKLRNHHSSKNYQAFQFTSRHLIVYRNPFLNNFNVLRRMAKEDLAREEGSSAPVLKKLLDLDITHISKDIRFFYPCEVQIVDEEGHKINTMGEASHVEYKKSQLKTAMLRLFRPLLNYYDLPVKDS